MIHYHGTPLTPKARLLDPREGLVGRCFAVSFAAPEQVALCHEIGQSVMLDNGAFSAWTRGHSPDWGEYQEWCEPWLDHRSTWAVIPDTIDGDHADNDRLIRKWEWRGLPNGAPVWHLHEAIERLEWLCAEWPRVCVGSSGEYADPTSDRWRHRMEDAFNAICPNSGPPIWLHMLRAMDQVAGGPYPFASTDSTNIARNHAGANNGRRPRRSMRAMADEIDGRQAPARWRVVERTAAML